MLVFIGLAYRQLYIVPLNALPVRRARIRGYNGGSGKSLGRRCRARSAHRIPVVRAVTDQLKEKTSCVASLSLLCLCRA